MLWITLATVGYLLGAVTNILDKFILAARIPKPSVYAFYVALFSLFAIVFVPFGFSWIGGASLAAALISGLLFIFGLLFFYRAVKESEISRVAPLVGVLMAIGTLVLTAYVDGGWNVSTSPYPLLEEEGRQFIHTLLPSMRGGTLLSFWLLVIGGFLVAFDLPLRPRIMFRGFRDILLASVLIGVSLALLKHVYEREGFIDGFVWSRIGAFIAGLTFLAVPRMRREIEESFRGASRSRKEAARTGAWFVVNKLSGALSALAINYAVFLGPLTLIHALAGIQYAFVFVLVVVSSHWKPEFFEERLLLNDWLQKIAALILIALGLYYAALSGAII